MADITSGESQVQGEVAHDSPIAGFPVQIGGRANANEPAVVADSDVTHAWFDLFGRLVVIPGHPSPEPPNSTNLTASGNGSLIATPGGGVSLYIVKGSIHNAGGSAIVVQLKDGSGGVVRWQAELAGNGGGSLFNFGARGWKLTSNTALFGNLGASGDVDFNVTEYYIAA